MTNMPIDDIQGTPRQWGIHPKRVVKHNHTRSFRKALTPSLFVGLWFSTLPTRETPWHIAYFVKQASQEGESPCWSVDVFNYATWKDLTKAHPFRFEDFDADMRYAMKGMRHEK